MPDEYLHDGFAILLGGSIILLLISGVIYQLTAISEPMIAGMFLVLFTLSGIGALAGALLYVLGGLIWASNAFHARKL